MLNPLYGRNEHTIDRGFNRSIRSDPAIDRKHSQGPSAAGPGPRAWVPSRACAPLGRGCVLISWSRAPWRAGCACSRSTRWRRSVAQPAERRRGGGGKNGGKGSNCKSVGQVQWIELECGSFVWLFETCCTVGTSMRILESRSFDATERLVDLVNPQQSGQKPRFGLAWLGVWCFARPA